MEQGANVETKAVVKAATKMYRVNQFAELAGVTVRALHHYDRLGLLKPSQRTYGGYRLYSESDLGRLEQIVVLKFLGLPLKQIRGLLRKGPELADALRGQQHVLVEKRRKLDSAIQAIGYAEHTLRTRKEPDWKLFKLIIQEVEMQNDSQWAKKYYSEAAQLKVEERKKLWSPELQERVSRDWAELFADVETALGEDPAEPKAQALAKRWKTLVSEFTGGDPGVQQGLNQMYADQRNWPEPQKQAYAIKPEIMAFMMKAMKAGAGG